MYSNKIDWSPPFGKKLEKEPSKNFDIENAIKIGVHLHDDQPAITYITQQESMLSLSQGLPDAKLHSYQSLPRNSIRLLKRVPQPDVNLLIFEFVTPSFSDLESGDHEYAAFSYCWGTEPACKRLYLTDDSYVPITAKVEKVLTTIVARNDSPAGQMSIMPSNKEKAEEPMKVHKQTQWWLDAVCIDQGNPAEKNLQIPLMADIYRYASVVHIWLDYGRASSEVLANSLKQRSFSTKAKFASGMSRKHDSWLIEPYSTTEITHLMWSPWFTRAWVVQEFCYGKRHCFHYGHVTLQILFLKMVHDFGSDLAFSGVLDQDGIRCDVPIAPLIENMYTIFSLRDRVQRGKGSLEPLENVLCRFFNLKASDPRDKIFAMLGLAKGDCLIHIKPDYSRTGTEIYVETMIAISKDITNFSLLSFAGLAAPRPLFEQDSHVPSWVPDFSTPPHHSAWSYPSRLFNATAVPENVGVRASFLFSGDNNFTRLILRTGGLQCDTVIGVLRGDQHQNVLRMPKFIKKAMAIVQSLRPYPSGEAARDVLMKRLIAANPDCLERDSGGNGFDEIYEFIEHDSFELDNIWQIEGRYMQTMIREGTAGSRGVFWTGNGYFGLAANEVEVDDEVWLVLGARVPFILRGSELTPRTKDGHLLLVHQLVCEAYVHGIMNGELSHRMNETKPVFLA